MSVEDVRKFFARLAEDKALMEEAVKAGETWKAEFQAKTEDEYKARGLAETHALLEPIARKAGYSFTLADLKTFEKSRSRELSDSELDAVSGSGVCVCVIAGGGTPPEDIYLPCGCVIGGIGGARCACMFGGGGRASF